MSAQSPVLRDLFVVDEALETRLDELIKAKLPDAVASRFVATAARRLAEAVGGILDVPVVDLLSGAWQKYSDLQKYRNAEEYPPENPVRASLGDHTVRLSRSHRIELLINGVQTASLTCDLSLDLKVGIVDLTIRGGRIYQISLGSCLAKGTVKIEEIPILERESSKIELPELIEFEEGIPLGL